MKAYCVVFVLLWTARSGKVGKSFSSSLGAHLTTRTETDKSGAEFFKNSLARQATIPLCLTQMADVRVKDRDSDNAAEE